MDTLRAAPGIIDLLGDLLRQISTLVSIEINLARAELAESSSRAMGALTKLVVGAVFLVAGFFVLMAALCAFLVRLGLPVDASCLIVAAVLMIAGGLSLRAGVSGIRPGSLMPKRSLRQISTFLGRT